MNNDFLSLPELTEKIEALEALVYKQQKAINRLLELMEEAVNIQQVAERDVLKKGIIIPAKCKACACWEECYSLRPGYDVASCFPVKKTFSKVNPFTRIDETLMEGCKNLDGFLARAVN